MKAKAADYRSGLRTRKGRLTRMRSPEGKHNLYKKMHAVCEYASVKYAKRAEFHQKMTDVRRFIKDT